MKTNLKGAVQMVKYTKEELIKKLKLISKKLGKTPTIKDIRKEKNFPSYISFYFKFGSWNNALKAAKLDLNYEYRFYSKNELLKYLIDFSNKNKKTPTIEDFNNNSNFPAAITYFDRFGSWNNALKLAGLEINVRKDYTKQELLEFLRNLRKELRRTPMMKDLTSRKNLPEATVFKDRFGSWNRALEAAGLEVIHYFRKWKKEEVIKWLNKKYIELGKTPGIRDFDADPKAPAKNTVRKLFGNWTNALREAKVPVKRFWSEKELIEVLQKLYLKLNRTPTREELKRDISCPSLNPFVKKFGSYTAACLRAGLVPNDGRNNKIWQNWEKHCIRMAKVIYRNIEVKNDKVVDGVPDIYVQDKKLFIDAKTCGYKDFKEQIKKYCSNGHKLEFWLIFKGLETKNKKVRYVYAKELTERMKQLGRGDLAVKCYQFIKNVFDEGQKVLV